LGKIGDDFARRLAAGEIIVLDGAVSTELQRRGVPVDQAAWYGSANLEHIDVVQKLHEDYIRAGAEVIIANTHSTSRAGLEPAGLGDRVEEINRRAVEAAIRARDVAAERPVAVAGSISSFIPAAMGSEDTTDLRNLSTFREQATILAEAGVDLIALEMMDSTSYGLPAIEAAMETGLPVWLGMSPIRFESGRLGTYSADKPCIMPVEDPNHPDAFKDLVEAYAGVSQGVAAVNLMHVRFSVISDGLEIIRRYFPKAPLGVYAEVGDWTPPNWLFVDFSPEEYLKEAKGWAEAGVQLIGSCCGTGPDHTRALAEGLPKHIPQRRKATAVQGARK
jgi:S-methylmethionine-dependent homocysteine/selenocysteine methylase